MLQPCKELVETGTASINGLGERDRIGWCVRVQPELSSSRNGRAVGEVLGSARRSVLIRCSW